jgi:hypothetical protein
MDNLNDLEKRIWRWGKDNNLPDYKIEQMIITSRLNDRGFSYDSDEEKLIYE